MSSKVNYIEFLLNNEVVQLDLSENSSFGPTTTVMEWLRSKSNYKGVKEGCAEGDCGACTVVLAELIQGKLQYRSVTSCILFLPYLNGKQLLTIEHLSSQAQGIYKMHPIQEILAKHNASQCGYCTPGIVMSLFSFYKNEETVQDIPNSLSGNLCRCTGYESIKEAAIEITDLSNENDDFSQSEAQTIRFLQDIAGKDCVFSVENYEQPISIEEALSFKKNHPESLMIGGASDIALLKTKKYQELSAILDLSQVKEMKQVIKTDSYLEVGAAVIMEQLRMEVADLWPDFKTILDSFGSRQIRNVATVGGNIGSASPIGDLLPLLMSHQAEIIIQEIIIQNKHEARPEQLEEFILSYRKTSLMPDELISKIIIPIDKNWQFWSEKVSKRRQLDISTVSASFAIRFTHEKKVSSIILAYGGMAAMPKRASLAEAFLLGKAWNEENIKQAAQFVKDEFQPLSDARASKEGRSLIASNLLLKFYWEVEG